MPYVVAMGSNLPCRGDLRPKGTRRVPLVWHSASSCNNSCEERP